MESPEEDEQPEAPAARLGGWGRAAPLFECRVRRNVLFVVPSSEAPFVRVLRGYSRPTPRAVPQKMKDDRRSDRPA